MFFKFSLSDITIIGISYLSLIALLSAVTPSITKPLDMLLTASSRSDDKLVNKGNNFENKTIHLSYDIDLNNKPWTPIGTEGLGQFVDLNNSFNGVFTGDGKTIYNLYTKASHQTKGEHLDSATSFYQFGLFGYVKNAKIYNLKIGF